jgi:hypothetical protein
MYKVKNVFDQVARHVFICTAFFNTLSLENGWPLTHLQRVQTDESPMEVGEGCIMDVLRSQSTAAGVFQQCEQQDGDRHCHVTTHLLARSTFAEKTSSR